MEFRRISVPRTSSPGVLLGIRRGPFSSGLLIETMPAACVQTRFAVLLRLNELIKRTICTFSEMPVRNPFRARRKNERNARFKRIVKRCN